MKVYSPSEVWDEVPYEDEEDRAHKEEWVHIKDLVATINKYKLRRENKDEWIIHRGDIVIDQSKWKKIVKKLFANTKQVKEEQ